MDKNKRQIFIDTVIIGVILLAVILSAVIFSLRSRRTDPSDTTPPSSSSQTEGSSTTTTTEPDESQTVLQTTEPTEPQPTEPEIKVVTAFGIDVSKYQGVIDWEQVAAGGIDFAMIRVGNRTMVDGEIIADSTAEYNIQQALKYGVDVGIYFFSTAVTEAEAAAEAAWVADIIDGYSITYPVAYNCEGFTNPESRQYELTVSQRTDIALAFLDKIEKFGYTPMFYAANGELASNSQWETTRIDEKYMIWVAHYPDVPYPDTPQSDYTGLYHMWQYSCTGSVPGINGAVDLDVAYFTPQDSGGSTGATDATIPWDELMNFQSVNEQVTAKEKTNLRSIPSQDDESIVLYTLLNGEIATRIGISDSGWSKVEFNGSIYYAVSSYLTTDLTPPEYEVQTQFQEVNELVTAKEVVNLRTLPSVTHEESEIVAQLSYGEIITRTGINEDVGWSRVEYNGQTLYCVSQYLINAEDLPEETE